VTDAEGLAAIEALMLTHFRLGGTLINANVLDRQTVLDACRHPDRYPDLVVRVTGFSAYFASLSAEFRKLVYERIVAMEGGAAS
jgi:formate C-acetyltransferase